MGFIDFTNGEVLTADQMDLVMRQGIMRFADATARDTALSAVLAEGMMAYLDDTDEVLKYDGTDWIDISGDITGVTAGTALTGGGTSGDVTLDVDESALSITASQISDVTASAAELNTLDGITATTAELNFTDGVTSAIQTQIDSKQEDVITTQGDLVIGDPSGDPVRLPVGSADQVLTSDGTTVSFQDAGGGGSAFTVLATGTLSGSSVSVTSLPAKNRYYVELSECKHSGTGTVFIQFNGDTSFSGEGVSGKVTPLPSYLPDMVFGQTRSALELYRAEDSGSKGFGAALISNAQESGTKLCNFVGAANPGGGSVSNFFSGFFTTGSPVTAINSIQINATSDFTDGTYRILGAD